MKKESLIQLLLLIVVSVGIFYIYMFSGETNFQETKKDVEQEIEKIYTSFDKVTQYDFGDFKQMNKVDFDNVIEKLPFDLFIYENDKLLFWSENDAIPDLDINTLTEEAKLITLKNGYYIALKKDVGNKEYVALSLLRNSYSLVNKYLNNSFSKQFDFNDNDVIIPSEHSIGEAIKSPNGVTIFKIQHLEDRSFEINYSRLLISILVVIFMYLFFLQFVFLLNKKGKVITGILVYFVLGILWILLLKFVPFEFKKLTIFNPEIYGSKLFVSLGLLGAHTIFYFGLSYHILINVVNQKLKIGLGWKIFSSVLMIFGFVYVNYVLRSLVLDSIIDYGAKNLTLFNPYAILGLILALFNAMTFVFYALLFVLVFKNSNKFLAILISLSVVTSIILYFLGFEYLSISLGLLMFLITYFSNHLMVVQERRSTTAVIIVSIFLIVLQVSSLLRVYTVEKSQTAKKSIAFKKSRQRDVTAEDLYSGLQSKIIKDEFVISFFKNPMISYNDIYKRMTYRYFGGYFSKYDVSVTAFNTEGNPIKFNTKETLKDYEKAIDDYGQTTINDKLFFVQNNKNLYSYFSLLEIRDKNNFLGTLAIKISPKTYDIGNVYPELLLQGKNTIIEQYHEVLEYAIYSGNVLIDHSDGYAYLSIFPENISDNFVKDGYDHSFFEIDESKKIIISTKRETFLDLFSVFSFVLCIYFLIGFIVTIAYFKITKKTNHELFNFSFRKRINIAMLSLVILSFIIIGMATVSFFTTQYDENHKVKLIGKQKSILTSLKYIIEKNSIVDEQGISNFFLSSLGSELVELSDIHKMDINIFSLEGKLIVSSQDGIFTSGLLSQVIDPSAFVLLNYENKSLVIQDESIGNLEYLSIYVPITNLYGEKTAFLNIPYFAKEKNLNEDISNFMISLINVYVLLLIIAAIVAFFVSNSITNPLKIIGKKIKEISLSKRNAVIEWRGDDEIGALVKEYNRMIVQLEESALLLASTERDIAWREMAKQIAHEIKNPLTPMKLSIQHMQRALKADRERGADIAEKMSTTLIEQIDNLSDIATAFSSFAKMPKGDRVEIDLIEVVDNVVDLFQNENPTIFKNYEIETGRLFADKNQLISVFNNLLKNAVQATQEKEDAKIMVEVKFEDSNYLISIKDNGVGIPKEKRGNVFLPNFTTKSSGTGLGLAISKKIIEGLNGSIWFKSEEDNCTTFFIKLPIL